LSQKVDELREYLATLSTGKIDDTNELETLLAAAWDKLERDYGGMTANKIYGRLEDVEWKPPLLSFTIERHGGAKHGSSRAELQDWIVDIDKGEAGFSGNRHRQIHKREPPLKTKPLAERISRMIVERKDCDELKWNNEKTEVRIIAGKVIPDDVTRQTLLGRRRRFRRDLTEILKPYHWEEMRPNKYQLSVPHRPGS